jgi:hypothetical protein
MVSAAVDAADETAFAVDPMAGRRDPRRSVI